LIILGEEAIGERKKADREKKKGLDRGYKNCETAAANRKRFGSGELKYSEDSALAQTVFVRQKKGIHKNRRHWKECH